MATRRGAAVLALLVAGCGSSASGPAGLAPPRVQVVGATPADAAGVPIDGASAAERVAVRSALARLGSRSPVTKVVFDHRGPRGRRREVVLTVTPRPGPLPRNVRGFEAGWLAQLAIRDIVRSLAGRGISIDWAAIQGPDGGGTTAGAADPPRSARELRRLSDAIVARGRAAGLEVRDVTALPIASGAVRVVVSLTERQVLANANARWLTTLVPDRAVIRRPYSAFLLVLGPGGIPVAYGANWENAGGGWSYGSSSLVHGRRSPPLPRGPIRFDIAISRVFAKPRRLQIRLDCGGPSQGVADPAAACRDLDHEWLAFLPPVAKDTTCIGGLTDQMTLTGTIGGVDVRREYSNCYAATTSRWETLLGVPRR